ncbi:MAG: alkene reductase, partial [Phormidesmis sp.]
MTSQPNVPQLLTPFDLNADLFVKNRIALAPMTRARADADRVPNALMAEYYAQRAGAGLIITEATTISKQANGWQNSPGIYTQPQTEGWKQVTEAVHAQGALIFLQLWHTGRASHSSFQENNQLPVAPSAIKIEGAKAHTPEGEQPYEVPRALKTEEIPGIVEDYRQAAENAKAAGFDGVEVHSANGYLLDEFLQSKSNQREDQYGGSLENRTRLLKEVVEAVLTVWPASRVGVKLSPNGSFNDMGAPDYKETFTYAAKQLNAYNLGYLHVVDGLAFGFHELGEPMTLSEFRAVYEGPLVGNCGYDRAEAEQAIAANEADIIAFGRPYISNPDLVERFANGWSLNSENDQDTWYSPGAEGYTDYS